MVEEQKPGLNQDATNKGTQQDIDGQIKVLSLKEQAELRGPPTSDWVTKK